MARDRRWRRRRRRRQQAAAAAAAAAAARTEGTILQVARRAVKELVPWREHQDARAQRRGGCRQREGAHLVGAEADAPSVADDLAPKRLAPAAWLHAVADSNAQPAAREQDRPQRGETRRWADRRGAKPGVGAARPLVIGNDCNSNPGYLNEFLPLVAGVLDVVTYHHYDGYGLDKDLAKKIMTHKFLDGTRQATISDRRNTLAPHSQLWVGEAEGTRRVSR